MFLLFVQEQVTILLEVIKEQLPKRESCHPRRFIFWDPCQIEVIANYKAGKYIYHYIC